MSLSKNIYRSTMRASVLALLFSCSPLACAASDTSSAASFTTTAISTAMIATAARTAFNRNLIPTVQLVYENGTCMKGIAGTSLGASVCFLGSLALGWGIATPVRSLERNRMSTGAWFMTIGLGCVILTALNKFTNPSR